MKRDGRTLDHATLEIGKGLQQGARVIALVPDQFARLVRCRRGTDLGQVPRRRRQRALDRAERLAACIEDRRDPDRVLHGLAEMIRYRAMLIVAGYPDGNDCDALRSDPLFQNGGGAATGEWR